jgi:hypothetical protein
MIRTLLIAALLLSLRGFAQVPGYMGKKISLGYRAEISPRIMDLFYEFGKPVSYDGKDVKLYAIAATHNIDVEWVVLKQLSLRFMYGFSNNGAFAYEHHLQSGGSYYEPEFMSIEFPKLSSEYDMLSINAPGRKGNGMDTRDYDYIRTSSTMLKYGLSFSRGFYFSPHGKTTSLYFIQNTTEAEYVLAGTAKPFTRINSYGFMAERSYRKIIADAVIFEYGVSVGYLFGSQLSELYTAKTAAAYFTGLDTKRILFQLSLGVRYLIPATKFGKK